MNLKAPLWVVTSRRRARSLMARSRTGSSVASSLAVSVLRGLADPALCGKTNLPKTERSPATPDSTRDNVRIFSEFSTGKLRDHHLPYLDRRDERTHKLFGQKERKLYLYIIQPDFWLNLVWNMSIDLPWDGPWYNIHPSTSYVADYYSRGKKLWNRAETVFHAFETCLWWQDPMGLDKIQFRDRRKTMFWYHHYSLPYPSLSGGGPVTSGGEILAEEVTG